MKSSIYYICRYIRTLSNLKFIQIYRRIFFYLFPVVVSKGNFPVVKKPLSIPVAFPKGKQTIFSINEVCFLNERKKIKGYSDQAFNEKSQLWKFNFHYFDDLQSGGALGRIDVQKAFIRNWIKDNPTGKSNAWHPYTISLRVVNWVKWHFLYNKLDENATHSMVLQLRYLYKKIEYHLLGNHLLANAKALVIGGLFFNHEQGEGKKWFEKGLKILNSEIEEQIWEDGAHFELSPMYQKIIVEDFLDLKNFFQIYGVEFPVYWKEKIASMLNFMRATLHQDYEISFFNDASLGVGKSAISLFEYAENLGFKPPMTARGLNYYKDSGLVRFEDDNFIILLDSGRIGPGYIFGHSHADTLSFEISYRGKRVFVNSGVSEYGCGPRRTYQRSTQAHNTILVDGCNQSELWAGFRAGRQALPFDIELEEFPSGFSFSGAHDGYHCLKNPVTHRRKIQKNKNLVTIYDRLEGVGRHSYNFTLKLHPQFECRQENEKIMILFEGNEYISLKSNKKMTIENSEYYPEFGKVERCSKVSIKEGCNFPAEIILDMELF